MGCRCLVARFCGAGMPCILFGVNVDRGGANGTVAQVLDSQTTRFHSGLAGHVAWIATLLAVSNNPVTKTRASLGSETSRLYGFRTISKNGSEGGRQLLGGVRDRRHHKADMSRLRPPRGWMDREQGEGHEFLNETTQVKNTWVPAGECGEGRRE